MLQVQEAAGGVNELIKLSLSLSLPPGQNYTLFTFILTACVFLCVCVFLFVCVRCEKQLQEEELSLQQQRRRLYKEVADEKERLAQLAAR